MSDVPKILLFVALLLPVFYWGAFAEHFDAYFAGSIINRVVTQQWHVVLLSILIFIAFLLPLSFRRKANWAERGIVIAFFVSLFVEMYGIPLTIFFASSYLYQFAGPLPPNIVEFSFMGVGLGMDLAMTYALGIIIAGMALIIFGWVTLYKNVGKNSIVTNGIYSYSRHPQYLGFLLIVVGWFVGWPTFLTIIFMPILVYKYVSVCRKEEKEMRKISKRQYENYAKKVPFFL